MSFYDVVNTLENGLVGKITVLSKPHLSKKVNRKTKTITYRSYKTLGTLLFVVWPFEYVNVSTAVATAVFLNF